MKIENFAIRKESTTFRKASSFGNESFIGIGEFYCDEQVFLEKLKFCFKKESSSLKNVRTKVLRERERGLGSRSRRVGDTNKRRHEGGFAMSQRRGVFAGITNLTSSSLVGFLFWDGGHVETLRQVDDAVGAVHDPGVWLDPAGL